MLISKLINKAAMKKAQATDMVSLQTVYYNV